MTSQKRGEVPISLVIPGRNVAETISECLRSVVPLLGQHGLSEIIFVDDGSTDRTPELVKQFPAVKYIKGDGRGRGAARNLGWRAASAPWIWFVDADCVVQPDTLTRLTTHLDAERLAGVGGSYSNLRPDSLLACLIHEEIITRHLAMPREVDFLATFNVIYSREALEAVGGFALAARGQDAELAYRISRAGYRLRFEPRSRVGHYHPTSWQRYLLTQSRHGYYRVWMYLLHPTRALGDSYSGWLDHIQPVVAASIVPSFAVLLLSSRMWMAAAFVVLLLLGVAQIPMVAAMVRRTGQLRYLGFVPMGIVRAFCRGAGMLLGVCRACFPAKQPLTGPSK